MPSNSPQANPAVATFSLEDEAQQVLSQLWNETALPFPLHIGKIVKGSGAYTIHFHDSRIRTTQVELTPGLSFQDMVRAAVLARVAKMSGPLAETMKNQPQ